MRRWHDDPFTKKARKENYEARSVYKLEEIDRRERVLNGASSVLDLGASPGSWTQYCLQRLPKAKIIAVDLAPLNIKDPRVTFLQQGIETLTPEILESLTGGSKIDLILSDMAPKTSGIHDRDVLFSFELAMLALETTRKFLKPKGAFVVKLFMGDSFEEYHQEMKKTFSTVKLLRPESTRKHSREIYFVGKELKT